MNIDFTDAELDLLIDAIVERRFGLKEAQNNERACTNNTDTIAVLQRQYEQFAELKARIQTARLVNTRWADQRNLVYDAHANGLITAVELRRALGELARTGHLTVKTRTSIIKVTEAGAACDCGKGILCSLNVQKPKSTSVSK